jgi:parallel beta-helix repeat protein
MKIKTLFNLLFILLLSFSIAGCSSSGSSKTDGDDAGSTPDPDPVPVPDPDPDPDPDTTNTILQLVPKTFNCADSDTLCVSATAGQNQEFTSIQTAVDTAVAGETVVVFEGSYAGFRVSNSGTDGNPIVVTANGDLVRIISDEDLSSDRIHIQNSNYVTIEGFTIDKQGASGMGITARGATADSPMHGIKFQFNSVSNADGPNIYLSQAADSLVLANTASGSGYSHGIYLANGGSDNTTLQANRCFDNASNGIHFNGDSSIGGDGLHTGLTIVGNIIYDNSANGIDADGVHDSRFENNLIYSNGRHALRVFQEDSSAGSGNLEILNNTLVSNNSWGIKLTADIGGHVIFNNIILGNGGGCLAVANTSMVSNNNIFQTDCAYSSDGESSTMGLSFWQSNYDTSSIESTTGTVLKNVSADDYSLASSSPAIIFGVKTLNGVTVSSEDIEATARPQTSSVDAGVYEFP